MSNITLNDGVAGMEDESSKNANVTNEEVTKITEEVTAKVTEDVTEDVTEKVTAKVTEEITEDITAKVTKEVTDEVTAKITKEVTDEVTAKITEEVVAKAKVAMKSIVDKLNKNHSADIALYNSKIAESFNLTSGKHEKALKEAKCENEKIVEETKASLISSAKTQMSKIVESITDSFKKDINTYNKYIVRDHKNNELESEKQVTSAIKKITESFEQKINGLEKIVEDAPAAGNDIDADELISKMTKTMEENISIVFGKNNLAKFKKYVSAKANGDFEDLDPEMDYMPVTEDYTEFIKVDKNGTAFPVSESEKIKIQRIIEEEDQAKIDIDGIDNIEDAIEKIKELAEETRKLTEVIDNFTDGEVSELEDEEELDAGLEDDADLEDDAGLEGDAGLDDLGDGDLEGGDDSKSLDDIVDDEDDLDAFDVDDLDGLDDFTVEDKIEVGQMLEDGSINSTKKFKRIIESKMYLNKKFKK